MTIQIDVFLRCMCNAFHLREVGDGQTIVQTDFSMLGKSRCYGKRLLDKMVRRSGLTLVFDGNGLSVFLGIWTMG